MAKRRRVHDKHFLEQFEQEARRTFDIQVRGTLALYEARLQCLRSMPRPLDGLLDSYECDIIKYVMVAANVPLSFECPFLYRPDVGVYTFWTFEDSLELRFACDKITGSDAPVKFPRISSFLALVRRSVEFAFVRAHRHLRTLFRVLSRSDHSWPIRLCPSDRHNFDRNGHFRVIDIVGTRLYVRFRGNTMPWDKLSCDMSRHIYGDVRMWNEYSIADCILTNFSLHTVCEESPLPESLMILTLTYLF